uniref:Various polyols ABC transporter, permease component 1 n=1 Tax=uncultured Thiotrichaceae bacterium TaxID=298394 RepID=A0A6S6TVZ9_9GAMM|nr:MAG: Various polyols ABC transporter, permease component 1 [uncultured Thiotrichaceae bacterium]
MATQHSRASARLMISPSVILLLGWMLVPLCMTVYFSFLRYDLLSPGTEVFNGWDNYYFFLTDPSFKDAIINTLTLVVSVLILTVGGGIALALLLDQPMWGQGIVRILVIAPFFVMPTVSGLLWKNMFMNPVNGVLAHVSLAFGMEPFDFLGQAPWASIIWMVSWQWLPFATLILLTAMQSMDQEQLEAAEMDGASWGNRFWHIMLPHMSRAITVVILIQTIFLLSIFAEILVTTNGGPGTATTNLTYLIYVQSLLQYDVGAGSAGGVIAIILANIVAIFLMRMIGKNLDN